MESALPEVGAILFGVVAGLYRRGWIVVVATLILVVVKVVPDLAAGGERPDLVVTAAAVESFDAALKMMFGYAFGWVGRFAYDKLAGR